jgi:hypothetical protein
MDFIMELPISNGCSLIWVVIDRLIKIAYVILLKDDAKKAKDLVPIFAKEI